MSVRPWGRSLRNRPGSCGGENTTDEGCGPTEKESGGDPQKSGPGEVSPGRDAGGGVVDRWQEYANSGNQGDHKMLGRAGAPGPFPPFSKGGRGGIRWKWQDDQKAISRLNPLPLPIVLRTRPTSCPGHPRLRLLGMGCQWHPATCMGGRGVPVGRLGLARLAQSIRVCHGSFQHGMYFLQSNRKGRHGRGTVR